MESAGMTYESMANLEIWRWELLLQRHGLLWVGALATLVGPGLHSRIVEGITGDGTPANTSLQIIDPLHGTRYEELFVTFLTKYEGGIRTAPGSYYQIRHFV
jgi:hypothetical protein